MAAKGNTKREILDAALELFSVQGYEATSISQLAQAVGIRKASLYSHFENKQAILDALIQSTLEQYEQRSIFARADWDDPGFTKDQENMTPETAVQRFLGQIHYVLYDPQISRASKDADDRAVSKSTDGAAANQADLHGCHALLHRSDPFSHPAGEADRP